MCGRQDHDEITGTMKRGLCVGSLVLLRLLAVTIMYLSQTQHHTGAAQNTIGRECHHSARTYRKMAEAGRESIGSERGAHARLCVRVRMLWMSGEVTLLPQAALGICQKKAGWREEPRFDSLTRVCVRPPRCPQPRRSRWHDRITRYQLENRRSCTSSVAHTSSTTG
jgi:hypothetical protein